MKFLKYIKGELVPILKKNMTDYNSRKKKTDVLFPQS